MLKYIFETSVLLALVAALLWMMSGKPDNGVPRGMFALMIMGFYAIWVSFTQAQFNLSADDTFTVSYTPVAAIPVIFCLVVAPVVLFRGRHQPAVASNRDDLDGTWINPNPRSP